MKLNTDTWNRIRYDLYAPFYDAVVRFLNGGRERSIRKLAPQPGESVLIVGIGTGIDLEHLPPGLKITGIDISPKMLEGARARSNALGRPATLRVMSAEKLDLPSGHFDCVVLHLILAVVPDPYAAIREAARVLKSNGRVAIFDKFLPDGQKPSALRKAMGRISDALFTDINRDLGEILKAGGLEKTYEEPANLGGFFRIVGARRKR